MILNFQPQELQKNKCLLFKTHSLWSFVNSSPNELTQYPFQVLISHNIVCLLSILLLSHLFQFTLYLTTKEKKTIILIIPQFLCVPGLFDNLIKDLDLLPLPPTNEYTKTLQALCTFL